jgi:hypothetical protein
LRIEIIVRNDICISLINPATQTFDKRICEDVVCVGPALNSAIVNAASSVEHESLVSPDISQCPHKCLLEFRLDQKVEAVCAAECVPYCVEIIEIWFIGLPIGALSGAVGWQEMHSVECRIEHLEARGITRVRNMDLGETSEFQADFAALTVGLGLKLGVNGSAFSAYG